MDIKEGNLKRKNRYLQNGCKEKSDLFKMDVKEDKLKRKKQISSKWI